MPVVSSPESAIRLRNAEGKLSVRDFADWAHSPSMQHFLAHIDSMIEQERTRLENCKPEEISGLQGTIRALRKVKELPESILDRIAAKTQEKR